jgi:hypothetical protein
VTLKLSVSAGRLPQAPFNHSYVNLSIISARNTSLTITTHPNISKVSATTPHTTLPIKPKSLRVLLQQVPYQRRKVMSHLAAQTLSLQGLLRIVVSTLLVSTKHLCNDLKPSPLMTNHITLSLSLGPCFRVVISCLRTSLLSLSRTMAATAISVGRKSTI